MKTRRWMTAAVAVLLGGGCASAHPQDDPLTRPIAAETAARWLGAIDPVRLHGNSFYIGFSGLGVVLIDTSDGLILIDGAVPQAVERLKANIGTLGFRMEDVKYILSTEPHFDHAGGIAALVRASGATVLASPAAVSALRSGRAGPDDPQYGQLPDFPGVTNVRAIGDRETIRLGNVEVTAIATPGHTAGSMSWVWRSREGGTCRNLVFGSSLNAISTEDYRFSDPSNQTWVETFRSTIARFRDLPCDLLVSAHPDQTGESDRLRRIAEGEPDAMIDHGACSAYADRALRRLEARLEREAGAPR